MTICIAGKNNIAVEILYFFLHFYKYEVFVICTKDDTGINSWQKSLRYIAKKNMIAIKELDDVYSIPDLLFLSLEFDRIVKPELFISQKLFNVHFSLLPAYKGMYTSVMPILYGEKNSGVTLHKIDAGIDTGEVIAQILFPITHTDVASDLYNKYILYGIEIIKKNISILLQNTVKSVPQPIEGSSYFSKKAIDFSNIQIDLYKTAWEIHNQLRAFVFRYYQLPSIGEYKIHKSEIAHIQSDKRFIGKFEKINAYTLQIQGIDYIVYAYIDFEEKIFEYAKEGKIKEIKQIIDFGYNAHIKNKYGLNLLMVAVYNERFDLIKYLISQRFDVNDADYKGTTILMHAIKAAAKSGCLDVINLLIANGADLKAKDDNDFDIFYYAKKYSNLKVMNYIQIQYDRFS